MQTDREGSTRALKIAAFSGYTEIAKIIIKQRSRCECNG